jgi:hypothetical protein
MNKEVQERIGTFYTDIRFREQDSSFMTKMKISYYPMDMLRRCLFVAIPIVLWKWPYLQLQALLQMSLFFLMYVATVKIHDLKSRCRMEIFNESMFVVVVYHFIGFPDNKFNQFDNIRMQMGLSQTILIVAVVLINLVDFGLNSWKIYIR